jgi:hypothetical protein
VTHLQDEALEPVVDYCHLMHSYNSFNTELLFYDNNKPAQ